ncbi:hypothetical protein ACFRAU_14460 [Arthrobacter sp. NPDC056691]|uniref:hypothetical protein n=1 Tax=Arthrobacter sp. NPDC056691 TaxID=3345913 RepID=UPI0036721319
MRPGTAQVRGEDRGRRITFAFKSSTTGRADVNKTYDFGNVAFTLNQIPQSGLS